MEFFILMISVPLFLVVVLLFSVFVLANYSRPDQNKAMPVETSGGDTTESADHVAI